MSKSPLVFYCCFGESYARLLNLSLHSLLDLGDYRGSVVVLTDLSPDALRRHCPLAIYPTLRIISISTTHELAFKIARYRLHRWFDISKHAPVVYSDCDIIFDRPIDGLLDRVRSADAICFPSEPFSDAMWGSMGGDFFRAEGLVVSGHGFNSGTMGIPDGASFRTFVHLETIIRTVVDLWTRERDRFDRWVDQPVLNYMQAKFGFFDTQMLTSFFRYCFQFGVVDASVEARTGAVHFFDDDKEVRMRDYLGLVTSTPIAENMFGEL